MSRTDRTDALSFLGGGGEMGARVRGYDWTKTPLGPPERWPQSLRSAVSMLLPSKAQIVLFWGSDLISIYNDAYRPVLGRKHPHALGMPARKVWSELWEASGLRGLLEGVVHTGEAFSASDRLFVMERFGYTEETYFDVSYDPVRDESGGVGGVYCIVTETTARVIGERRLETLGDLGVRTREATESVEAACSSAVRVLAANRHDLPFALVYLLDADDAGASLCRATGVEAGAPAAPLHIDLAASEGDATWPLLEVLRTRRAVAVTDVARRFGAVPGGPWPEPAHTAVVLPIARAGQDHLAAFLVAGISPRRALDQPYRDFLELVGGHLATAIGNARAYHEERQRAEALAELDRAKTAFFSNVSHEFRTPLALMLGPLEDALASVHGELPAHVSRDLAVSHRNAQRLLKLVNALLDFSRIEAGRAKALYEPVDLAAYTAELASSFRSACDKAGLDLVVRCAPLPEPVYVDRDMWEKVVLNLVSNAFKFTLAGEIEVRIEAVDGRARLVVRDTGIGIPAAELPRMFERFHRVDDSRGRTHEGTGIGLALVQELVKLHGGRVEVESTLDEGSRFTVTLPFGTAHLAPERLAQPSASKPARIGAAAFVEEALRWIGDDEREDAVPVAAERSGGARRERARVVWADDNADMRAYVARILSAEFDVTAVSDGEEALEAIRSRPPDLLLADVMMPRLDGFGLLRALRADPATIDIPVILLSARAGEEARIEGLEAGADDYVVKPFSARDLMGRVRSHVETARGRREAAARTRESEQRFRAMADAAPAMLWVTEPGGACTFLSRSWYEHTGQDEAGALGAGWLRAVHPDDREETERMLRDAGREHAPFALDCRIERADGEHRWAILTGRPRSDPGGRFLGYVGAVVDVHERRQAEATARRSEIEMRRVLELNRATTASLCEGLYTVDRNGRVSSINPEGARLFGWTAEELIGQRMHDVTHHTRLDGTPFPIEECAGFDVLHQGKALKNFEDHFIRKDGTFFPVSYSSSPIRDAEGNIEGLVVVFQDITERKNAERIDREREVRLASEADALARLNELSARLWQAKSLDEGVEEIVSAGIELLGGDKGNVQLLQPGRGVLRMVAQRGFEAGFVDRYREVAMGQDTACGRALRSRERVIVADVESDALMRAVGHAGGFRAVQSTALVTRDGQELGMLSTHFARPHRPGEQELRRLDLYARQATDFIERMQAEEALRDDESRLRDLAVQMSQLAAERERLLDSERAARATADRAIRVKDEFLATLSHELRTPINAVLGWAQLGKRGAVKPEDSRQAFEVIERNARIQSQLINDLLDMNRISAGKVRLELELLDPVSVIENSIDAIAPTAKAKGVVIETRFDARGGVVRADPSRLQQVIWNLLANAVKFTEPAGRVTVSLVRGAGHLELSVADTGVGIQPEFLGHIFERFRQADASTTRRTGGLGLGLAIAKQIVELHGGSIGAASEGSGRGAVFTVRLPLASTGESAEAPALPAQPSNLKGVRILVVDDEPDALELARRLLVEQEAEVMTAASASEALAQIEARSPSVMISDIGMPEEDGYTLIRRVRALARRDHATLPAIALTAFARNEDRAQVLAAGFQAHVVKPVEVRELCAVVTSVLQAAAASSPDPSSAPVT